jgi:hypothetical protein
VPAAKIARFMEKLHAQHLEPEYRKGDEAQLMLRKNWSAIGSFLKQDRSKARPLSALIFDGVLERFSRLKFGGIEQGASWVPGFMRQLDSALAAFSRMEERLQKLSLKRFDESTARLSPAAKHRFFADNFVDLMGPAAFRDL